VVGEVEEPGILALNDLPMTIADAISLSGGLTPNAYKSGVDNVLSLVRKRDEVFLRLRWTF